MAVITPKPFKLGRCKLTIALDAAENDYEKTVSAVEFKPSSRTVEWKGLDPEAVFTFPGATTWTCDIAFAQDWSTTGSLSRFLFDHDGEEIDVTFEPVAGGTAFEATLVVLPGSIGGSVDSVAVSTVSLGVQGKPAIATP